VNRVPFTKMEGLGNDYVLVDALRWPFPVEAAAACARAWSDRHFGIGADGLIVLSASERFPVRMAMWNADGSRGAMCGNGLRCLARMASAHGHVQTPAFVVETDAGPRGVELLSEGLVRTAMGVVRAEAPQNFDVADRRVELMPGDAGNPHAVCFVADVERAPVLEVGTALQHHPAFPAGVNVEFVQVLAADRLRQRTFERGSGETLACGTGAAVAVVAARRRGFLGEGRAAVELRGGVLFVDGPASALAVEGPARSVFVGEVELPETFGAARPATGGSL
jgi:diaminopimelate epimerase